MLGDQLSQLSPLQAQLGAGGQIQLLRVTGNGGAASQPIILQATAAGTPQTATAAAQHQNPAPPQAQHHAAAQTIFLPNGQQVRKISHNNIDTYILWTTVMKKLAKQMFVFATFF